jgi:uncharacterized protein YciI
MVIPAKRQYQEKLSGEIIMEAKHFVFKLIPPRSSFAQDMTEEERNIMQQHVAYWTGLADRGIALVFGPVLDPKGAYGLGIIEVANEEQIHLLAANDPAVKSGIGRMEMYPMLANFRK